MDSKALRPNVGKDGEKEILCVYQAGCKPFDKGEDPHAPTADLDQSRLIVAFGNRELKPSTLTCKGRAPMINGVINSLSAKCPPIDQCRSDVFYNYIQVDVVPLKPNPVSAPELKAEATK
jgi:hypothetical protein